MNTRSFHIPPEDAPHQRTLMQWPVLLSAYGARRWLEEAQDTIATIANTISAFEPVALLMAPEHKGRARRILSDAVEIWDVPTDDLWARDSGPIFAFDDTGRRVIQRIQFNGWGNRQAHAADARIAARIAERLGLELVETGLVGEGGGIEHNGAKGAESGLLAHESSWLNPNRNPGMGRDEIGDRLKRAYGAEWIIWSKGVYDLDVTDYHIDGLVRFTAADSVLMNLPAEPDPADPFHVAALETKRAIEAFGLKVNVIEESRRHRGVGEEFVTAYANYYVCNGAVIAPEFGDRDRDAAAVAALTRAYPEREIITLNIDPLAEAGGGIHCATQQMPAALG